MTDMVQYLRGMTWVRIEMETETETEIESTTCSTLYGVKTR